MEEKNLELVISNDTGICEFRKPDTGEVIKYRKITAITNTYQVVEFSLPKHLWDSVPTLEQGTAVLADLKAASFKCLAFSVAD